MNREHPVNDEQPEVKISRECYTHLADTTTRLMDVYQNIVDAAKNQDLDELRKNINTAREDGLPVYMPEGLRDLTRLDKTVNALLQAQAPGSYSGLGGRAYEVANGVITLLEISRDPEFSDIMTMASSRTKEEDVSVEHLLQKHKQELTDLARSMIQSMPHTGPRYALTDRLNSTLAPPNKHLSR